MILLNGLLNLLQGINIYICFDYKCDYIIGVLISLNLRSINGVVEQLRMVSLSQLNIDITYKTTVHTTYSVLQINLMCTDQL